MLTAILAAAPVLAVAGCSEGYDVPPMPAQACSSHAECPLGYRCDMFVGLCGPQGDVDCLDDNEPSQGDICTKDCLTASCASGLGQRVCTCEGGVFVQCACLPPDDPAIWPYDDVPAAPYCEELGITGQPRYLATDSCPGPGAQCRSNTSPEVGCICQGPLWECGVADALMIPADAPICEQTYESGYLIRLDEKPCDVEFQLCIARNYNPTGTSPRGCACLRPANGGNPEWSCGATNRWYRAE